MSRNARADHTFLFLRITKRYVPTPSPFSRHFLPSDPAALGPCLEVTLSVFSAKADGRTFFFGKTQDSALGAE